MSLCAEFQWIETAEWLPAEDLIQAWINAWFSSTAESLSVVIRCVNDQEIQQLNNDYRQKDCATNVLSFPFDAPKGIPNEHLGDIIISLPYIAREAAQQDKEVSEHFAHMVLHGLLHLHGYDHIDNDEAEEMESLEVKLLAKVQIDNPYST